MEYIDLNECLFIVNIYMQQTATMNISKHQWLIFMFL